MTERTGEFSFPLKYFCSLFSNKYWIFDTPKAKYEYNVFGEIMDWYSYLEKNPLQHKQKKPNQN